MSKIDLRWIEGSLGGTPIQESPSGAVNSANRNFVISQTPIVGTLRVFVDGLFRSDFTFNETSRTITFTSAPIVGQIIEAVYTVA